MSENQNAQNTNVTDDFELPGVPDAFQRLWTPHRTAYVSGGQQDHTEKTCPFCTAPSRSDEESLIVYRGEHTFALLNLYPYNPGHLLICPYPPHSAVRPGNRRRNPRNGAPDSAHHAGSA